MKKKDECNQSVSEKYLSAEAKVKEALKNLSEIGISKRKMSDEESAVVTNDITPVLIQKVKS